MGRVRRSIIYTNGDIDILNMTCPMLGNHKPRRKRLKPTSAAVQKTVEKRKVDHVEAMLKNNFEPYDWHYILTYSEENKPADEEQAKKDLRNFKSRLKRYCKSQGWEYPKWAAMSEQGTRRKRWHHHIVLPQRCTPQIVEQLWGKGFVREYHLWANWDFRGLAQYFCDKTKQGRQEDARRKGEHAFSFSHNCVKPKTVYEYIPANFAKKPRIPKGYELKADSLVEWVDPYGYKYQKYSLIKIKRRC